MHKQVNRIDQAADIQEEDFRGLIAYVENQKNFLASTPLINPTKGWVSSKYGYRVSPFTGRKNFTKV